MSLERMSLRNKILFRYGQSGRIRKSRRAGCNKRMSNVKLMYNEKIDLCSDAPAWFEHDCFLWHRR